MLHYLGRYTHRVAISNHRLVSFADEKATFRWRDSAHNNEQRLMTLSIDEFLRRFLLHLLPQGFVRIRHFGLLASQPAACHFVAVLLSVARLETRTSDGTRGFNRQWSERSLALSQMCWTDGGRREAHCRRDPTPAPRTRIKQAKQVTSPAVSPGSITIARPKRVRSSGCAAAGAKIKTHRESKPTSLFMRCSPRAAVSVRFIVLQGARETRPRRWRGPGSRGPRRARRWCGATSGQRRSHPPKGNGPAAADFFPRRLSR